VHFLYCSAIIRLARGPSASFNWPSSFYIFILSNIIISWVLTFSPCFIQRGYSELSSSASSSSSSDPASSLCSLSSSNVIGRSGTPEFRLALSFPLSLPPFLLAAVPLLLAPATLREMLFLFERYLKLFFSQFLRCSICCEELLIVLFLS